MDIKLSVKAFAQFVTSGPSKRAQIVRNIRSPKSLEAKAISHYYAKAVDIIRIYHAKGNDRAYLAEQIRSLQSSMDSASNPWARAKFGHNIRVVEAYVDIYGKNSRKILSRPRLFFKEGRVRVSAFPDIAIEECGRRSFIKLGPTKQPESRVAIRVILRVMFLAARARFEVSPGDITYLDITGAAQFSGDTEDVSLMNTIENACQSLTGMC